MASFEVFEKLFSKAHPHGKILLLMDISSAMAYVYFFATGAPDIAHVARSRGSAT